MITFSDSFKLLLLFESSFQNHKYFDYYLEHLPIFESSNPFPNKPWFLRVCSTSLLKTLWEKDKLLVTSNFSFSHSVFYPF